MVSRYWPQSLPLETVYAFAKLNGLDLNLKKLHTETGINPNYWTVMTISFVLAGGVSFSQGHRHSNRRRYFPDALAKKGVLWFNIIQKIGALGMYLRPASIVDLALKLFSHGNC